jgi:hypothetical protein
METCRCNTVNYDLKQSFYIIGRENDHICELLR